MDIFLIILGVLSAIWTYCFYDADLIPLILAITIGVTVNMLYKLNEQQWPVLNPMHKVKSTSEFEFDDEEFEEDDEEIEVIKIKVSEAKQFAQSKNMSIKAGLLLLSL